MLNMDGSSSWRYTGHMINLDYSKGTDTKRCARRFVQWLAHGRS